MEHLTDLFLESAIVGLGMAAGAAAWDKLFGVKEPEDEAEAPSTPISAP